MNSILKAGCLVIYTLALASMFVALPWKTAMVLQYLALILLGAHLLEVLIAFRHVKRYQGPLIDSIALTLLFGLLHWQPLSKR